MTCPKCARVNRPCRRYCGACGCNFAPHCATCGFSNDHEDRFCGGCGDRLGLEGVEPVIARGPAPQASVKQSPGIVDELEGLFAVPAVSQPAELPSTGIAQDDLDRVFGANA